MSNAALLRCRVGSRYKHDRDWQGDHVGRYNVFPGLAPWMIMLHNGELQFVGMTWGYRSPNEAAAKRKPWINARIEKALTGQYFRHMFREGRIVIPAGGWFEWTVENGKKRPWYITRKVDEPIFMAGITNYKLYAQQTVETGFVIATEDSGAGMVDIHDPATGSAGAGGCVNLDEP
ncbi:SOS response-associated peptidase family protein [Nitrosospira sp. Is2]|nr:SOS response-associated peptidase family protein [Nitrosospira sp. Is2]WON75499.1 SOS response-associated peptidase family protein [Nitrosospira sp. Is2]